MKVIEYMNINTGRVGRCTEDQFNAMIKKTGFRGKFAKIGVVKDQQQVKATEEKPKKKPKDGYTPPEVNFDLTIPSDEKATEGESVEPLQ
jgi:recombinational DNA repair protein RecT